MTPAVARDDGPCECSLCGTLGGHSEPGKAYPERTAVRKFGITGLVCRECREDLILEAEERAEAEEQAMPAEWHAARLESLESAKRAERAKLMGQPGRTWKAADAPARPPAPWRSLAPAEAARRIVAAWDRRDVACLTRR